jgi:hypothetical protein
VRADTVVANIGQCGHGPALQGRMRLPPGLLFRRRNNQTSTRRVGMGRTTPKKARPDAARAVHEAAVSLPDVVTVAIAELAGESEEGLFAFVVGTG